MVNDAERLKQAATLPGYSSAWRFQSYYQTIPVARTQILPADAERWSLIIQGYTGSVYLSFGDQTINGTFPGYFLSIVNYPLILDYRTLGAYIQQSAYCESIGIPTDVYFTDIGWRV